jgi:hypothetical protein
MVETIGRDAAPDGPASEGGLRRPGGGFFSGLLCGLLVGAAAAVLLAPDRGAATRRRLREGLRALGTEAGPGGDLGDRARRELVLRQRQLRARLERAALRARRRTGEPG